MSSVVPYQDTRPAAACAGGGRGWLRLLSPATPSAHLQNSSAVSRAGPVRSLPPPVKRTRPLGSSVAVWKKRAVVMVAVRAEKVLAVGSYSSAVLKTVKFLLEEPLPPPVMSTVPLGSRVAV